MSNRTHESDEKERRHSGDSGPPPEMYSIFQGEVASVQTYGVFVKIPGSRRQGLVHKSQMSRTRVDDPSEMLSKGEVVYCKVISHGEDGNKIGLSMKVVNQTTGADVDPNNVELSQDEQRRRTGHKRDIQKIELGAFLNTTCKKCGAKGHFTQDCFHVAGGKSYELVPDFDEMAEMENDTAQGSRSAKKRKKEKKKHKKHKKESRKNSSDTESSEEEILRKKHKKHKSKDRKEEKHRKRKDISSDSDSPDERHSKEHHHRHHDKHRSNRP